MRNYSSIGGIIFRVLFLLIIPFLFVQTLIYTPLSSTFCFSSPSSTFLGTDGSPSIGTIEQKISNHLNQTSLSIQDLNPVLPLNLNWLRFNVLLQNNLKIAIVVSEPKSYNEATTTFYIQTQNSSSTIPYGDTKIIASGLEGKDFTDLITNWSLSAQNNSPIIVGAHQVVELQDSPALGQVCVYIEVEQKYKILIYIETLFIFIGLLILLKEALNFIILGLVKYFLKE